ncbi:MAG TPA: hypothetical protein VK163_03995 [Opitutaceae bacterium]|nr:hypothetical protein [Opitutaceae bacterium]
MLRRTLPALLLALLTLAASAQEAAPPRPEFRFAEVAPVVRDAGIKAGLPLDGFDHVDAPAELREGDKVVALVDHVDGKRHRQWLVLLAPRDLTEDEKKIPQPKDMRMHTSLGRTFDYTGQNAMIAIRCLGPYEIDDRKPARKARDKWSGTMVNDSFLRLGFDDACRMWLRIDALAHEIAARENRPLEFNLSVNSKPFKADTLAHGPKTDPALLPTETEERAFGGTFLALMSFFDIAMRTPGLDDVLASVVDVSWLSLLGHLARPPAVNIEWQQPVRTLSPADWALPEATPLYAQPFLLQLNGRPALRCQLAVRSPQLPFLASAGIVGVAAQRPDGAGPQLSIRVIAARCIAREPELLAGNNQPEREQHAE